MSFDYNHVEIIGHCGNDPEIIATGSNTPFAKAQVATNKQWRDKDNKLQQRTTWHTLIFNNNLAEVVGDILKKGDRIFVRGQLQTSKWQDKDGNDRISTFIRVDKFINFSYQSESGDSVQSAELEPDVADTEDTNRYQNHANAGRRAAAPKSNNAPRRNNNYRQSKAPYKRYA